MKKEGLIELKPVHKHRIIYNYDEITISLGYDSDQVRFHDEDGKEYGVRVHISEVGLERTPEGILISPELYISTEEVEFKNSLDYVVGRMKLGELTEVSEEIFLQMKNMLDPALQWSGPARIGEDQGFVAGPEYTRGLYFTFYQVEETFLGELVDIGTVKQDVYPLEIQKRLILQEIMEDGFEGASWSFKGGYARLHLGEDQSGLYSMSIHFSQNDDFRNGKPLIIETASQERNFKSKQELELITEHAILRVERAEKIVDETIYQNPDTFGQQLKHKWINVQDYGLDPDIDSGKINYSNKYIGVEDDGRQNTLRRIFGARYSNQTEYKRTDVVLVSEPTQVLSNALKLKFLQSLIKAAQAGALLIIDGVEKMATITKTTEELLQSAGYRKTMLEGQILWRVQPEEQVYYKAAREAGELLFNTTILKLPLSEEERVYKSNMITSFIAAEFKKGSPVTDQQIISFIDRELQLRVKSEDSLIFELDHSLLRRNGMDLLVNKKVKASFKTVPIPELFEISLNAKRGSAFNLSSEAMIELFEMKSVALKTYHTTVTKIPSHFTLVKDNYYITEMNLMGMFKQTTQGIEGYLFHLPAIKEKEAELKVLSNRDVIDVIKRLGSRSWGQDTEISIAKVKSLQDFSILSDELGMGLLYGRAATISYEEERGTARQEKSLGM